MKINIKKNEVDSTLDDINNLEKLYSSTLPQDYKSFLTEYNGGFPDDNMFRSPFFEELVGVRYFFGFNSISCMDLMSHIKTFKNRVPENVIPIGEDDCGNLFCLSLRDKDYNAVYFWDHELEADEDEPPTESNLFKLTNNFNEFLEGLEPFDESLLDKFPMGEAEIVFANIEFLKAHGADPKFIEELERKQNQK